MAAPQISENQSALIIWSLSEPQSDVLAMREQFKSQSKSDVALEVFERVQDAALPASSYDLVSTGPKVPPLPFTDEVYALVSRALAPSGTFAFQELVLAGTPSASSALPAFRQLESLPLAVKLAGFVSPAIESRLLTEPEISALAAGPWASWDPASATRAALEAGLSVAMVRASKPSYATGSASAIKLPLRGKKLEGRAEVRSPPPAVVGWSDNSDDGELEDEDALLDEADRAKPAIPDDCEMTDGKRKACKNCVCGRAEEEAAEDIAAVKISSDEATGAVIGSKEIKSSCGSCYLGDAFRCSTCPYMGMPAFQPGEKVELTGIFASSDIDFE